MSLRCCLFAVQAGEYLGSGCLPRRAAPAAVTALGDGWAGDPETFTLLRERVPLEYSIE
jgi:hypothetical protein